MVMVLHRLLGPACGQLLGEEEPNQSMTGTLGRDNKAINSPFLWYLLVLQATQISSFHITQNYASNYRLMMQDSLDSDIQKISV